MGQADLPAVQRIADTVHVDHPEDAAILAERLRLYPQGCFVLEHEGAPAGYLVSHPWRADDAPKLNRLIGALPQDARVFYLHDLALLPGARGSGEAASMVARILDQARESGFAFAALIAVDNSARFWSARGFEARADLTRLCEGYGAGARFMQRALSPG
jgi:GNAT superfamily N-acetyltransferase